MANYIENLSSLDDALHFVKITTPENLKRLNEYDMFHITRFLDRDERYTLLFEKNLKIFGDINEYVNDFFNKHKNLDEQRIALPILKKMIEKDGLTQKNRRRLELVIDGKNSRVRAGGGKRGKTKKHSRRSRASSK